MKNLKRSLFFFACLYSFGLLSAQENTTVPVREPDLSKPALFKNYPDHIPFLQIQMESLLQARRGQEMEFTLAPGFLIKGNVTSALVAENGSVHNVVMRLEGIEGAFMNFSKSLLEDGTEKVTGMIMSYKSGDAYELIKEGTRYYFIKKGFYDLINE